MGQAKVKAEQVRKKFLEEAHLRARPYDEREAEVLERILKLKFETINRAPEAQLEYMGMKPQQCHENCYQYAKLDPEGKAKPVYGWWRLGEAYVFHSVVGRDGGLACITPHSIKTDSIEFARDPDATEREDGFYFSDGTKVPQNVRIDQKASADDAVRIIERLNSGMNPYKAVELPD